MPTPFSAKRFLLDFAAVGLIFAMGYAALLIA